MKRNIFIAARPRFRLAGKGGSGLKPAPLSDTTLRLKPEKMELKSTENGAFLHETDRYRALFHASLQPWRENFGPRGASATKPSWYCRIAGWIASLPKPSAQEFGDWIELRERELTGNVGEVGRNSFLSSQFRAAGGADWAKR